MQQALLLSPAEGGLLGGVVLVTHHVSPSELLLDKMNLGNLPVSYSSALRIDLGLKCALIKHGPFFLSLEGGQFGGPLFDVLLEFIVVTIGLVQRSALLRRREALLCVADLRRVLVLLGLLLLETVAMTATYAVLPVEE